MRSLEQDMRNDLKRKPKRKNCRQQKKNQESDRVLMQCSNGHGEARLFKGDTKAKLYGTSLIVYIEKYICDTCGLEWCTAEQICKFQRALKSAYARKERERYDRREVF